ncbi:MAG: response regulator [Deltaproteobacteria bacterium]|nr:response regulator [Deltaproteobacteria bacterium]
MTILIVEDEIDARETLRDAFEDAGYSVGVAANGLEALAILQSETPKVVLLDLVMPMMTGNEVYEAMRREARWSSIPVVITTSDPSRAPDGTFVMRKPLDLRKLLLVVEQIANAPPAKP